MKVSKILSYVHRSSLKDFCDHGRDHSIGIIKILNEMIEICKESEIELSQLEIKLLYVASWLHDIGCIVERKNHSIASCRILSENKQHFSLNDLLIPLNWIIKYHSSSIYKDNEEILLQIKDVPETMDIMDEKIKLQLLSAIFRLADACDITKRRAPPIVFNLIKNQMDEESKKFWIGHQHILSIRFDKNLKAIKVTVRDVEESRIIVEKLAEELESVESVLASYNFPCLVVEIEEIKEVDISES